MAGDRSGVPISALPQATAASSADVLAGVQNGTTKKFSFAVILNWIKNVLLPSDIGAQSKIISSGVLKGDGQGNVSAATAGTDYATPGMIPSVPAASAVAPPMDGTGSAGTWNSYARGNHVHPSDTSRQAKITASGILMGNGNGGVSAAVAGTDYQTPLTAGTDYATPGMIPSVPAISAATPGMDGTADAGSTGDVSDAGHVHPSDTSKANQDQLAFVETGSTAGRTNGYAAGDYFCWEGKLYRAKTAISEGAAFTEGTNCEEAKVTDPLADALIAKSIGSWSSTTATPITFPRGTAHLLIFVSTSSTKGAVLLLNCSAASGFIAYQAIYKGANISFTTATETLTATLASSGDTVFVTDLPLKGGENNQYASM